MDCVTNIKGCVQVRLDEGRKIKPQESTISEPEESKEIEPVIEEPPEEPPIIVEKTKEEVPAKVVEEIEECKQAAASVDEPTSIKPKPYIKSVMPSEFKLKLKLPGLSAQDRGFMLNIFEEALNDHKQIKIPKCNWAYKLEPLTRKVSNREEKFMYIIPYCFASPATPEALERGLLESITFREDDKCLSGLKLVFDNGRQKQESPPWGRRLLYDKTIVFEKATHKLHFKYNLNVT